MGDFEPGDLSGPEVPSEAILVSNDVPDTYGGARAPLGGSGGLVTGED